MRLPIVRLFTQPMINVNCLASRRAKNFQSRLQQYGGVEPSRICDPKATIGPHIHRGSRFGDRGIYGTLQLRHQNLALSYVQHIQTHSPSTGIKRLSGITKVDSRYTEFLPQRSEQLIRWLNPPVFSKYYASDRFFICLLYTSPSPRD